MLGPRRHPGRWPGPLNVDQHGRHLGKIAKAEEFVHQAEARPAGRGKRTSTVPIRTHHHTDRSQFVFGLDDRVVIFASDRVDTIFSGIFCKGIDNRSRWRDRVPCGNRRSAIYRPETTCRIAAKKYLAAKQIASLNPDIERIFEICLHVIDAHLQGFDIRLDQFFLAFELLADQAFEHRKLDIAQRRDRSNIDNILKKLPLTRVGKLRVA